jgi:hypothetical protein
VKIDKKILALFKQIINFQGGYGRLQLGDIYTFHGFLQRTHESKEADSIIKKLQAY